MKGVRKKTDPYDYLGHLVPLLGGDFNEDQKIDSINAGLKRRARDQEQSEIPVFPMN